ncbi:hypothetical protein COO60DRAFT_289184 [Scenedesmus sp. NREL 46B-D3]|nr:hypothetical protein COO60DRAFT_289184 [Scenedesmus sp. NREL 46B-D3]
MPAAAAVLLQQQDTPLAHLPAAAHPHLVAQQLTRMASQHILQTPPQAQHSVSQPSPSLGVCGAPAQARHFSSSATATSTPSSSKSKASFSFGAPGSSTPKSAGRAASYSIFGVQFTDSEDDSPPRRAAPPSLVGTVAGSGNSLFPVSTCGSLGLSMRPPVLNPSSVAAGSSSTAACATTVAGGFSFGVPPTAAHGSAGSSSGTAASFNLGIPSKLPGPAGSSNTSNDSAGFRFGVPPAGNISNKLGSGSGTGSAGGAGLPPLSTSSNSLGSSGGVCGWPCRASCKHQLCCT